MQSLLNWWNFINIIIDWYPRNFIQLYSIYSHIFVGLLFCNSYSSCFSIDFCFYQSFWSYLDNSNNWLHKFNLRMRNIDLILLSSVCFFFFVFIHISKLNGLSCSKWCCWKSLSRSLWILFESRVCFLNNICYCPTWLYSSSNYYRLDHKCYIRFKWRSWEDYCNSSLEHWFYSLRQLNCILYKRSRYWLGSW